MQADDYFSLQMTSGAALCSTDSSFLHSFIHVHSLFSVSFIIPHVLQLWTFINETGNEMYKLAKLLLLAYANIYPKVIKLVIV